MMKVLFCGKGHMADGFIFTSEALSRQQDITVCECERDDLESAICDATVIVPLMSRITKEILSKAPKLRLIMQYGTGLEGVDMSAASELGIYVSKIPSNESANAVSCAEHAIFLALAVFRNYNGLVNSLNTGRLGYPSGRTLLRSSVAIIGLGGIGIELTRRLHSFGVSIHAVVKRKESVPATGVLELLSSVSCIDDWSSLAPIIDLIILCCPLNPENRGMVNKQFLAPLKDECVIVNIARGGLLDYNDVYEALANGRLGGLGLDVFHTEPFPLDGKSNDPVLSHPKVISTPHVAGVTRTSYREMAGIVADNVVALRDGGKMTNVVNISFMSSPRRV